MADPTTPETLPAHPMGSAWVELSSRLDDALEPALEAWHRRHVREGWSIDLADETVRAELAAFLAGWTAAELTR